MSNVTGENLDYLKMFLNLLTTRSPNTGEYLFWFFTENLLYISESGMIIPDLTFYEFRIQEKALELMDPMI